jgi:hypothetical protein
MAAPKSPRAGEANPFYGRRHTDEWRRALSERQNTWTSDDLVTLRRWYVERQGKPLHLAQLVEILGKSKGTVCRMARTLGLTARSRPTGQKSRAKYATPEERKAGAAAKWREHIAEHGHPRGFAGKQHSDETRARISEQQRAMVADGRHPGQRPRSDETRAKLSAAMQERLSSDENVYSRCKYGRRADLNFLVGRGIVARWEYEAETFWFERVRRGVRSYKPDFRVTEPSGAVHYVEVKGWMDPKSKTKLARMARYHADVDLRLVDEKAYREIEKHFAGAIPWWE